MKNEYYIVKINEKITVRGMNTLFFEVKFKRVYDNGKLEHTYKVSYQRGNIAIMLHGSSLWYIISFMSDNEVHLSYEDYIKYRNLLEEIIKRLGEIEELTERTLTKWN